MSAQVLKSNHSPQYAYLNTPIGLLEICAIAEKITRVAFVEQQKQSNDSCVQLTKAQRQLAEYFSGKRDHFTLELDAKGTVFQQNVWQSLTDIPYGETTSYQKIAEYVSSPKAVRAVGSANGKNPIAIIVPCHRVIGKNGTLTGYAGGLDRKQWLLSLEQKYQSLKQLT